MLAFLQSLFHRLWPPVPMMVRDDLALLRYASLQAQVPSLYATAITVIAATAFTVRFDAPFVIDVAFPAIIIAACATRLTWWLRNHPPITDAALARRRIMRLPVIACPMILMSSIWTVMGWSYSDNLQRAYYPMFMALGILSTAFCMSTIRATTVLLLVCGLLPLIAALAIFGNQIDQIAAAITSVAALFLLPMVMQRHAQLVALLTLQQQMRELAGTDPLTGLANRRRLLDRLRQDQMAGRVSTLLVLDLDGFKPVNDVYGHAVGDLVLCEVAARLRDVVSDGALVCRMGGDEFAIVITDANRATVIADQLLTSLVQPICVTDATRDDGVGVDANARNVTVRIGASIGIATAKLDAADTAAIIADADARLYLAKAARQRPAPPSATLPAPIRSGSRG